MGVKKAIALLFQLKRHARYTPYTLLYMHICVSVYAYVDLFCKIPTVSKFIGPKRELHCDAMLRVSLFIQSKQTEKSARFSEELQRGWREESIEVRLIYYDYEKIKFFCGLGF